MKNGNKRGVITADVGSKEKRTLKRLARECGLTVSDIVRLCLRPVVSGKLKVADLLSRSSA
jgi:antitoxin component of RelBE/YafQ-DinJ toxin-antitoxin module